MFDVKKLEESSNAPLEAQKEWRGILTRAADLIAPMVADPRAFHAKLRQIAPAGPEAATAEQHALCSQTVVLVAEAGGVANGLVACALQEEDAGVEKMFVEHLTESMALAHAYLAEAETLNARWHALGQRPN